MLLDMLQDGVVCGVSGSAITANRVAKPPAVHAAAVAAGAGDGQAEMADRVGGKRKRSGSGLEPLAGDRME